MTLPPGGDANLNTVILQRTPADQRFRSCEGDDRPSMTVPRDLACSPSIQQRMPAPGLRPHLRSCSDARFVRELNAARRFPPSRTAVSGSQNPLGESRGNTLILGLTVAPTFPVAFVILVCAVAAAAPFLYRRYSSNGWRIPLSHCLALLSIVALMCVSGSSYMRSRHSVDRLHWFFDNRSSLGPVQPTEAELSSIEFTPFSSTLLELGKLSLVPAAVVFVTSLVLTRCLAGRALTRRRTLRPPAGSPG